MTLKLGDLLINEHNGLTYEVVLEGDNIVGVQSEQASGYVIIDKFSPKGFRLLTPEDVLDGDFEEPIAEQVVELHQDEMKLEVFLNIFDNTGDSSNIVERTRQAVNATKIVLNEIFRDNL